MMHVPDTVDLLTALAAADKRVVVAATGGGSAGLSRLVSTPGASTVFLEGLVPYAREAVDRLLGGPQESYCSPRTARRLAVAAWQRAIGYGAPADRAVGAAVVASLRTVAPKRGAHRVIVAIQTIGSTTVATVELDKDARSRAEEEEVAAGLLLCRIGCTALPGQEQVSVAGLRPHERIVVEETRASPEWRGLLAGTRNVVGIAPAPAAPEPGRLLFPGSFDPLHDGHRTMARLAEEIAEQPVEYELSVTNVAKPVLDYHEIETRVTQFAGRPLWLTRAATFLEKLAIFPRSTFVLGADTFVRLADPRFYGGSTDAASEAVRVIADQARGLIVFGRAREGTFTEPSRLDVPEPLRSIAYFVSQREFRMDVSSTALRREKVPCDAS